MKKITMIVVLLMMTTMNLMADVTPPTTPTITVNPVFDGDAAGKVIGQIDLDIADVGKNIEYSLKGKNDEIECNSGTGELTIKVGFSPLVVGESLRSRFQIRELDEGDSPITSWVHTSSNTIFPITDGPGDPVARPLISVTAFNVPNSLDDDDTVATLSATGGTGFTFFEVIDTVRDYDNIKNDLNFDINETTGEIIVQDALMTSGHIYAYKVKIFNSETGSTEQTISITVLPDVEPTFTTTIINGVYENLPQFDTVGTVTATSGGHGVTFAEKDGGVGENIFDIDSVSGEVTLEASALSLANTPYSYEVIATDLVLGTTTEATITINVIVIPAAPAITTTATNIAEVSGTFSNDTVAANGGQGTLTYTEVGTQSDVFDISSVGVLSLVDAAALDYENATPVSNTFEITVLVTESGPSARTAQQTITITVTDENEVTLDAGQIRTINTGVDNGTLVGTVLVFTDEDPDPDTTEFTIMTEQSAFDIDNNGQITVADNAEYTADVYPLTIRVSDSVSGDSEEQTVTITGRAPIDLLDSGLTVNVEENTEANQYSPSNNSTTAQIVPLTPVATYSVVTNDYFEINATGFLVRKQKIDRETPLVSVIISVTVTTALDTDTEDVTVNITDLADTGSVSLVANQDRSIHENAGYLAHVGVNDPLDYFADVHPNIYFSSSDSNFDVSKSGQITVSSTADLDYEIKSQYVFEVTITDSLSGVADIQTVTVNITDQAEDGTPEMPAEQGFTIYTDNGYTAQFHTGVFLNVTGEHLVVTHNSQDFGITNEGEVVIIDPAAIINGAVFQFTVTATNTDTSEFATSDVTVTVDEIEYLGDPKSKKSGNTIRKTTRAVGCLVADLNPVFLGMLMGLLVIVLLIPFSKALKA